MADKSGVLRIFFRGLCVFHYKQGKEDPIDKVGEINVLLPDARIPEECFPYKYDAEDPLFPHTPLLSIPKALLDPLPNKKPHKFTFDDDFIFPLTNHMIEIISSDTKFEIEDDFVKFIPNLPDHVDKRCINNRLLRHVGKKIHAKLSAFLKIDKGTISIPPHQNTEPRRAADYIKTRFEKANGDPKNKIETVANCVCWEINIAHNETMQPLRTKLINKLVDEQLEKLSTILNESIEPIQNLLDTFEENIEQPYSNLLKEIQNLLVTFEENIEQPYSNLLKEIQNLLVTSKENIEQSYSNLLKEIQGLLVTSKENIEQPYSNLLKEIQNLLVTSKENIEQILRHTDTDEIFTKIMNSLENVSKCKNWNELDKIYEERKLEEFQEHFEKIVLPKGEDAAINKGKIESLSTEMFAHEYYPFTITLTNRKKQKLSLKLQLKPKIKKEKGKDIIVGAIPGNIYITNMPLEGVNMYLPFQRERDLDFALTHSVLDKTNKDTKIEDLTLPRRIPSPDELNDQEQTIPPMMCACVRCKEEV